MRTEEDLRDAFALLEHAADAGGDGRLAPVETRRRRWIAPVAAAASVALIAGTAAAVVALSGHHTNTAAVRHTAPAASTPAPPTSSAPLTTHSPPPAAVALHTMPWRKLAFTVTAPGLTAAGAVMDTNQQTLDLVGPSGSYVVRVYTDKAGRAYDPTNAAPVEVNGHRGFYAQLTSDSDGSQFGVAWEYAPGAWASVARVDTTISSDRGVQLAKSVRVGTPSIARTPVSFAPVTGLHNLLWLTGYGNDPNRVGQHGYSAWNALYDFMLDGAQITVTADDIPGGLITGGDAITIHGHSAHVVYTASDHLVSIAWNGHTVNIIENVDGTTGGFHLTRAQILAVARSVTLIDHPADTSAWLDASSSLPA